MLMRNSRKDLLRTFAYPASGPLLVFWLLGLAGCAGHPPAPSDPAPPDSWSWAWMVAEDSLWTDTQALPLDSSLVDEEPSAAENADETSETIYPLSLTELEDLYCLALDHVSAGHYALAEDLLFVLQDRLAEPAPAGGDSLGLALRRSLARRSVLLGGLLAESRAFASGQDSDSLLSQGYAALAPFAFPDSLVPITGARRPSVAADLLMVDNALVRKWEDYFRGPGRRQFMHWLRRKSSVDSLLTAVLAEEGLPRELVYLSMIESGFSPHAHSTVGAVGPWQFMPGTAKLFQLRYDWWVDERRDVELSTRAAAAYLRRLYDQFHDWALVLAAYNAGERRIERAIRLSGHDDYWRLRLPSQTEDFVPKFIAAARLGEDPAAAGFALEPAPPLQYDVVPVDDATDLALIARCAHVPAQDVVALNPALLRRASPPDSPGYPVRVPAGTGAACRAALKHVPAEERLTWRRHRVKRGETLSEIALQYGTSVGELVQLNKLRSAHLLHPGDQLLIPMPVLLAQKAKQRAVEKGHYVPPEGYRRVTYKVEKGDTLTGIARKLGVSLRHLERVNGLRGSLIHPGQKLYAYRPAA